MCPFRTILFECFLYHNVARKEGSRFRLPEFKSQLSTLRLYPICKMGLLILDVIECLLGFSELVHIKYYFLGQNKC